MTTVGSDLLPSHCSANSFTMAATYVPVLGTSNVRGSSRQTRTNPTRISKTNGSSLRQNSLITAQPPSVQGGPEQHGFYPAIQHFTDATTALPREYRRHTSLLKEVDAKAWQPEDHLQIILTQCLADQPTLPVLQPLPYSAPPSTVNLADEAAQHSTNNSVAGAIHDGASQISSSSSTSMQRRQVVAALRHNLAQLMHTMDEKNHVINNANEELSCHIQRCNILWPHLSDEISEEARLGNLKHWALTDLNPPKKGTTAGTSRRDANLGIMQDNEVAQRSESRREAVAAKTKQRLDRLAQQDSGAGESRNSKKRNLAREDTRANDSASEVAGLGITAGKGKKGVKTGGVAMEKSLSVAIGGRAMSREPSQQDAVKKRKAPAGGVAVARKRYAHRSGSDKLDANNIPSINAAADSPKLASSPLAATFSKDAYKRSPALAAARPVSARARQNSAQTEPTRAKSSTAQRNATNNGSSSKNTTGGKVMEKKKEDVSKPIYLDEFIRSIYRDQEIAAAKEAREKTRRPSKAAGGPASKTRDHEAASAKGTSSSRLSNAGFDRAGRGRASKTSTPVVGTFKESESFNRPHANGNMAATAGNSKAKRPARPRPKYDGLHDSLSPKGLPPKRIHKKSGSIVTLSGSQGGGPARLREENSMDSRLQRTNSGISGSGSGNATPVNADGSEDEDSTTANDAVQTSEPRQHRSRQRSRAKSAKDIMADGEDDGGIAADEDVDMDLNEGDSDVEHDATAAVYDKDPRTVLDETNASREYSPDPVLEGPLAGLGTYDIRKLEREQALAEAQAAAGIQDQNQDPDGDGDGDVDEDDFDDGERYCYCQKGSRGEMVACDNDNCPREWFHMDCIGMTASQLSGKGVKWYCLDCKPHFRN